MSDAGTELLRALGSFGAARLKQAAAEELGDGPSLIASLAEGTPPSARVGYEALKAAVDAGDPQVAPMIAEIERQTRLIAQLAADSLADAGAEPFGPEQATRIATRTGTTLLALEEAAGAAATALATSADGAVDAGIRDQLMAGWNLWVKPFAGPGALSGGLLDSFAEQVLDVRDVGTALGGALSFDPRELRLGARFASRSKRDLGPLGLDSAELEAFLDFEREELPSPSAAEKAEAVESGGSWLRAGAAVFGLRVRAVVRPGLQSDPLLRKLMSGAADPQTLKPVAFTLDSARGLYLGDGSRGTGERVSLPVRFGFPAVEVREVALGLIRKAGQVSGLELTTVVAAKLGGAVGMVVSGAGATIALDGARPAGEFPWELSSRGADGVGLRIDAGPVKGGGYVERQVRNYGGRELVEYGGTAELQILGLGVTAIVLLSPEPFSLVLVMGVRFPTAIELSFGFTLNGVGGILALDRRVDSGELIAGMQSHFVDRVLFPADPVAEAPKLLDQVAHVFPPQPGGFIVGPIVELGWGSQARIVEAKLGIVIALPDPKLILLGAVRVRAPAKEAPLVDLRCEVYGEISADRLLLIASLRDSKIAGIDVSGDLGLLIQWGGAGAFALSVGGFNPRYTEAPPELASLQRLTIDLSPPAVVKIVVQAYFAITAGAVMAGVRGDLKADVGIGSGHAWLQLDMIFTWSPRFGFAVDLELGITIEVFGRSFASIQFRGALAGTTPWSIEGSATVDVRFLPTYHFDLGPFTWGDGKPRIEDPKSPLELVSEAMNAPEAWKAVMPLGADAMVHLDRVGDAGMVAHPLAALEVTQSRVPLETHIDRIGTAPVSAHRVTVGLASTAAGTVKAVSTVKAPFAPGQFLALEGEALLARSGFDQMPSGCRLAATTTPVAGKSVAGEVKWRTFYKERGREHEPAVKSFDPGLFSAAIAALSPAARAIERRDNPYMTRAQRVDPDPAAGASILPPGVATIRRADDGAEVLADLGVLTASEAGRVADTVNASGEARLAAVALGVS